MEDATIIAFLNVLVIFGVAISQFNVNLSCDVSKLDPN